MKQNETFNEGKEAMGCIENFLSDKLIKLPILNENLSSNSDHIFSEFHNLSIYFNKTRKLALYSACNYNKEKLIEKDKKGESLKRGPFEIDPNVGEEYQLGQGFYYSKTIDHPTIKNKNVFDRGHIISRRYTQWGDSVSEAKRNADETFNFTNIAPQTWQLNQHEWESIEAFVIEHKKLKVKRATIFSGVIFNDDDPVATYLDKYEKINKQIKIPILYWKIVYYLVGNELRRIAFMLSQKSAMEKLDFLEFKSQELIRDDPFEKLNSELETFIVKVSLIEEHTGLKFTSAKEKFGNKEPLKHVIEDNNIDERVTVDFGQVNYSISNISKFI